MIQKTIIPTEAIEQAQCIKYLIHLRNQGEDILYSATAQNTFTRSWNQKRKNTLQGVTKGLPDLVIVINQQLVFVEMKRLKGGVVSEEQKIWKSRLLDAGQIAVVCKGFDNFKNFIDQYVKKQNV